MTYFIAKPLDADVETAVERLAHTLVYLLAVPLLRTLTFTLAFVCLVGLFVQLLG